MEQVGDGDHSESVLHVSSSSSTIISPPKTDFKFELGMNKTSTPISSKINQEFHKTNNNNNSSNKDNNNIIIQSSSVHKNNIVSSGNTPSMLSRFPSVEKRRNSNVFAADSSSFSNSTNDNIIIKKNLPSDNTTTPDKESNNSKGLFSNIPDLTLSPDTPPALPTSAPPPSFSIGSSALNFNINTKVTNGIHNNSSDVNHGHVPRHRHSHSSSSILGGNDEQFECFPNTHEPLLFHSASENTSLQYSRDASDLSVPDISGIGGGSGLPFKRNTVLRTSLRKSPQHNAETMGHRRWGSFRNTSGSKRPVVPVTSSSALATQLYRSSSFHSSGRSSAGDGEEMYSDGSLEDEVIDLTQKVHHLEEKFTVLAENQSDVDDRYTRAKQENAEISTKLFMVEEQLRDAEQRAEEKLREEQRRFKESFTRLEREKHLQIESYGIRLQTLEKDLELSKTDNFKLKLQLEREKQNHIVQNDKLVETERELSILRDDNRNLMDQSRKERECLVMETTGSQQALVDIKKEVENLRRFQMANSPNNTLQHRCSIDGTEQNELKSRLIELEHENKQLKQENKKLHDTNEDLSAQLLNQGLEEGLHLLTLNNVGIGNGNSLAAEFEAMSQDQVKIALKEQKEVNDQLRTYIDGILLNIVENYPQLLEVKNKCNMSSKY